MISRYVLDVLRILGRYSRRVVKVQILCVHPVDMYTIYIHCIPGISTPYPTVIHTPFPEEHPFPNAFHDSTIWAEAFPYPRGYCSESLTTKTQTTAAKFRHCHEIACAMARRATSSSSSGRGSAAVNSFLLSRRALAVLKLLLGL